MKASDLIAKRIKEETDTVFGVTGGCVVNLVDSLEKEVKVIPMYHEQSASIAADAYARFKGFGVVFGTSGPGNTNLVTGTCCSYYDSVPVLTIGGQVQTKLLNVGRDRQFGFQEVDGVKLFRSITKYSRRMEDMQDLEDAIYTAKEGRPGPTFLEICDDLQRNAAWCNLVAHRPHAPEVLFESGSCDLEKNVASAKKPLIIVGSGARNMPLTLEVPFLYTWGVKDKWFSHPYCKGDFGITGSPNGNRLTKESDLIVMIGTKMDTHQAPNWEDFAPNAYKIAVGLEFPHEVNERHDVPLNFPLNLKGRDWGSREENTSEGELYQFIDHLNAHSREGDVIIPDMGQTGCIVWQRWKPKKDQRLFNGVNHSPMGYSLPASVGASMANPGKNTIVVVGDGSFMMNMQDLQTIRDYNLPVKTFIINNGGYGMIKQTQADWPESLRQDVACNLHIPNTKLLASSFGIKYASSFREAFQDDKPTLSEIKVEDTTITPKWKYGEKL